MNNTINGRTPDEIKKALRICSGKLLDYCDACNYCNWNSEQVVMPELPKDDA